MHREHGIELGDAKHRKDFGRRRDQLETAVQALRRGQPAHQRPDARAVDGCVTSRRSATRWR
ncbi:MAG: hypothetical protein MZV64_42320 [Ignavibacteriales bacterium]|nr:hypothetical protein [Ignavibacteriales bacterium]